MVPDSASPVPTSVYDEWMQAFMERDASYEGVFIVGVVTTGIFCRPTCPARKPLAANVRFFATARDALDHGFRPCKRCRPMNEPLDTPDWVRPLLDAVDADPSRRWKDRDLRAMDLSPERVRRWFRARHGMTFHAYSRARRLGNALGHMQDGKSVTQTAMDNGYDSLSGFAEAVRKWTGRAPVASRDATRVFLTRIPTPVGPMIAGATEEGICLLEFTDRRMLETQLKRIGKALDCVFVPEAHDRTWELETQLADWFAGDRTEFDVPLILAGTPFQETVWKALLDIPFGSTASYADLARTIGNPNAVRAVARANGDNRIAIVIPCHRVIGSDGSLTGYGGGLWRKKKLLEHESGARTIDLFEGANQRP